MFTVQTARSVPADVEFVIERGRRSLEAFLKYYVATHNLKKRPEYRHIDDMRKHSKDYLSLSSSSQSLESGINEPALTVPNGAVPKSITPSSNSAAESKGTRGHSSPSTRDDLSIPGHSPACRTKSGSSGKSVSISDKVEIMEDKVGYGSCGNVCELEENESCSNAPEESDSIFLLNDKTDTMHHGKNHDALIAKNQKLLPESNTLHPQASKLTSSLFGPHKNIIPTTKERGKKLKPSLKVDVQIHKSHEKPESPTTPLLQGD